MDELLREIKINGFHVEEFILNGKPVTFVNGIERVGTYDECIKYISQFRPVSRGPRLNYNEDLETKEKRGLK